MVKVHFLNVGIGDCTIIHFPERQTKDGRVKDERIMMIDMYHHDDDVAYENVMEYYKRNFRNSNGTLKPIFRFVCTHPHQDHICGLEKLFSDHEIKIFNFWDLSHQFVPEDFSGHPTHEDDWETYVSIRNQSNNPKIIRTTSDDNPAKFWDDDEDRVTILSPSNEMIKEVHSLKEDGTKRESHEIDIDKISYALMVRVNDRKLVFAGDGKSDVWDEIVENFGDQISDVAILKAPHHGHESGFNEVAVKTMNPGIVVFSNSEEADMENGAEDLYTEALGNTIIAKTHKYGTLVFGIPFDSSEKISINGQ